MNDRRPTMDLYEDWASTNKRPQEIKEKSLKLHMVIYKTGQRGSSGRLVS